MALVLVAGAVLGAQAGGRLSKLLPVDSLRTILSIIITLTALKMGFEINSLVGYSLSIGLLMLTFLLKAKRLEKTRLTGVRENS